MNSKRTDYISWKEYFMGVAQLSAMRSKDPSTQVGSCIVNSDNKIVGIGYNGFPQGVSDDSLPWKKDGEWIDTKYPYVCHAEMNAIMNAIPAQSLKGCILYTTLFPCNECAKMIIQAGISEVIYMEDKNCDKESTKASKILFNMVKIPYHR